MLRIARASVALTVSAVAAAAGTVPWKKLTVEPWGKDTFRVRFSLDGGEPYNGPGALEKNAPSMASQQSRPSDSVLPGDKQKWVNGNLQLSLNGDSLYMRRADGQLMAFIQLAFKTHGSGEVENITALSIASTGNSTSYFGFGEHENGKLDQVNTKYDMESCIEYSKSKGGEICLPWVMVADDFGSGKHLQFGVLWNVPAYGSAEFGNRANRSLQTWTGFNLDQVDLLLTTYAEGLNPLRGYAAGQSIMNHYVDAVGHAPELPEWASGYWHSRNRYKTQDSIEDVMDIFAKNYSIPVSVYVVDYYNWAVMGNLTFDPSHWPKPQAMVAKAKGYGAEIMVSTWPFSQETSKTYLPLQEQGFAVFNGTNRTDSINWPDGVCGSPCRLYDASNPEARKWWWQQVKEGYFDYGIKVFWLDASEPEQQSGSPIGSSWSVGSMQRVGMMFPWYHAQTYHEGMMAAGAKDGMMLSRSAWAGIQKYRAAVWNGDTQSKFSFLTTALQSGLNIQMSGVAWWTTDIGGYSGGQPSDPTFRELIVRWFQFGFTSPLFRQHGGRPTEPWLLGDEAFGNVRKMMALREEFRPYILAELRETSASGLPLNRPLFFDYPGDNHTWGISDQFMFGRDYMAAPVYTMGARSRDVYFPLGSTWIHHFTGASYSGGSMATIEAPMDHFPLFKKVTGIFV